MKRHEPAISGVVTHYRVENRPGAGEEAVLRERLQTHDCGRVLDCAAGDGRFLALLAASCARYTEIVAVDPDRDALDEARRSDLPRSVRFLRAAGEALPFASASFDTACISDGLHHVRNPLKVLSELRRVVVPGGVIIISEILRAAVSDAAATAIRLHHFKARLDLRRGVRHRRTLSEPELLRVVSEACSGPPGAVSAGENPPAVEAPTLEAPTAGAPAGKAPAAETQAAVAGVEVVRVAQGGQSAAQALNAEQRRAAHAERLRDYMQALRRDTRYPRLRAVAETLAARVTETGFTPPPRLLIFIRTAAETASR